MRERVIDGDQWIADRLAFLHDLLQGDLPTEQRKLIEEEIETLTKQRRADSTLSKMLGFPPRSDQPKREAG